MFELKDKKEALSGKAYCDNCEGYRSQVLDAYGDKVCRKCGN